MTFHNDSRRASKGILSRISPGSNFSAGSLLADPLQEGSLLCATPPQFPRQIRSTIICFPKGVHTQNCLQHGKDFFAEICARDLEGIVAKRKLGIYKDDGNSWLKVKIELIRRPKGGMNC